MQNAITKSLFFSMLALAGCGKTAGNLGMIPGGSNRSTLEESNAASLPSSSSLSNQQQRNPLDSIASGSNDVFTAPTLEESNVANLPSSSRLSNQQQRSPFDSISSDGSFLIRHQQQRNALVSLSSDDSLLFAVPCSSVQSDDTNTKLIKGIYRSGVLDSTSTASEFDCIARLLSSKPLNNQQSLAEPVLPPALVALTSNHQEHRLSGKVSWVNTSDQIKSMPKLQ